jgi:hypothetical protein
MKRILIQLTLLVGALALATAGLADPGGKGKAKKNGHNRFSAQVVVPDNGTCGNAWATDTSTRTWSVKSNKDGTFRVTRKDKGTFVTNAGASPSACSGTAKKHGKLVNAGVKGKFRGYLTGTVSGGTFNPDATCNAACIGDTSAFIAAFFGASAKFTCSLGYAGCKFNFEYSSPNKSLIFRHWQDKGTNGVSEQFVGDIANS